MPRRAVPCEPARPHRLINRRGQLGELRVGVAVVTVVAGERRMGCQCTATRAVLTAPAGTAQTAARQLRRVRAQRAVRDLELCVCRGGEAAEGVRAARRLRR